MDTEFDAVPELVPDGNRHALIASEMHCSKQQGSLADIPYTSRPFTTSKTSRLVDSTTTSPRSFVASKASYGEADRVRCHFSWGVLRPFAVRRARVAKSKTSFGDLERLT